MDYRSGCTPVEVIASLKKALVAREKGEHCVVLWFAEVWRRKLYRALGYSSMNQFAEVELKFSRTRTGDYLRLAGKLEELPKLRDSVASGRVGYSKAREVIKVATPRTEDRWVAEAENGTRSQLRQRVKQVKEAARRRRAKGGAAAIIEIPVRLSLEMSPAQFARFEALLEKVQKQGRWSTRVETVLAGLESLTTEDAPTGSAATDSVPGARRRAPADSPVQIHLHQCPDCHRASLATSRGELPLSPSTLDHLACDARVHQQGKRSHATVTPALRREVLSRDRHTCQSPGCRHNHHLEVHHHVPRSRGGSNRLDNLITLCSACHRLWHEKGESMAKKKLPG